MLIMSEVSEVKCLSGIFSLKVQHKSLLLLLLVVLLFKGCLTEIALLLIFPHTHVFFFFNRCVWDLFTLEDSLLHPVTL